MASKIAGGRIATVAIDRMAFMVPVAVGAQLSFYTQTLEFGRSSIRMLVEGVGDDPLSTNGAKSPRRCSCSSPSMAAGAPPGPRHAGAGDAGTPAIAGVLVRVPQARTGLPRTGASPAVVLRRAAQRRLATADPCRRSSRPSHDGGGLRFAGDDRLGMIDIATRSPSIAVDPSLAIDHRHVVLCPSCRAGWVEMSLNMVADELVEFGVRLHAHPEGSTRGPDRVQRQLVHDLAGPAGLPSRNSTGLLVGHVEQDARMLARVLGFRVDTPAATAHRALYVRLEAVLLHACRCS